MIFKTFCGSAILDYQVALYLGLAFDPFGDVSWTVMYDSHGWNRLKTTATLLKKIIHNNII